MESSKHQATLGKRIVKLYVTDTQGNRLSFYRAAIRCWHSYITNLTLGLGYVGEIAFQIKIIESLIGFAVAFPIISCLYIFLSPKNQGLHDFVADALVLKKQRES